MTNTISISTFKDNLLNSQYAEVYSDVLGITDTSPISVQFLTDISESLNLIYANHSDLTAFQQEMLVLLFEKFNQIRTEIDPNRLKPFEYTLTCDDELLLHRKSDSGVTSITFNPEDCLAFSFIPYSPDENRVFFFVEPDGDFESLALKFFAN